MLDFKVTLRVASDKHTLEEIKFILGEPTKGFSIGDDYSKGTRKRKFTLWSLESSKSPDEILESHLEEILNYLDSRKLDISIFVDVFDADISCMLSSDNGQGGATLSAKLMKKISEYNLNLVLDVYAE